MQSASSPFSLSWSSGFLLSLVLVLVIWPLSLLILQVLLQHLSFLPLVPPIFNPSLRSYPGSAPSLDPLSLHALAQWSVLFEPPTKLFLAPMNVNSSEVVVKPAVRLVTDLVLVYVGDAREMSF